MKNIRLQTLSLLAVTSAIALPLQAQASMDYASLESLFGEPVTTSATGTPQRASEVAANMTIITADEIRQSGSRSVPEILDRVPGMTVLRSSYGGYDVGVRGYQQPYQPRLLVLIDGRQVFIDDYSRTIWNNLPINVDDIRQIEVVKGPATALFGSNASGGVVNIVTYNPMYDKVRSADVYVGSQRTAGADSVVTANGEWGGVKFTGGGYDAHNFNVSQAPSGIDGGKPYHRYATNSTVLKASDDLSFNLGGTYSVSNETYSVINYVTGTERTSSHSVSAGFDWRTSLGTISNNTYYNHNGVSELLSSGIFALNTDMVVSQLQDQFKLGSDHTFRVALEYRNKWFSSPSQPGANYLPVFGLMKEEQYATSATWLWNINDKWAWTNAVRFDHLGMRQAGELEAGSYFNYSDYSHVINTLTGNSSLSYKATQDDTFRLTYGRGVQLPSLMESGEALDISYFGAVIDVSGNPTLDPTYVTSMELGYDRKIASLYSTASASIFYQINQDIKAPEYGPITMYLGVPHQLYTWYNIGNNQGWGGELQLKGAKDGFRWNASYSLAFVNDYSEQVSSLLGYNRSAPEHQFRLMGGYTTGSWEFDAKGQYNTSTDMYFNPVGYPPINRVHTDPYFTLSARVGYNINEHLTMALSGTNLTRQYTTVSPYPQIERQLFLTMTGKF